MLHRQARRLFHIYNANLEWLALLGTCIGLEKYALGSSMLFLLSVRTMTTHKSRIFKLFDQLMRGNIATKCLTADDEMSAVSGGDIRLLWVRLLSSVLGGFWAVVRWGDTAVRGSAFYHQFAIGQECGCCARSHRCTL